MHGKTMVLGTEPAEDVITGLEFLVDLPGCDPLWISRMKEKVYNPNLKKNFVPLFYFSQLDNGYLINTVILFHFSHRTLQFF